MPGTWTTFNVPNTSSGSAFTADIMLLLTDGSVLIHNGYAPPTTPIDNANTWLRLTPDAHGHYETGSWSGDLDMKYGRQWFASGVLGDGRVYCIGGEYCSDPSDSSDARSGETFDPRTNLWSPIAKPSSFDFVRGDCNGAILPDGRVLLGGASTNPSPSNWSKRTAIWDPHSDTWTEAGLKHGTLTTTDKKDPFEEEGWALLADGSVLAPAVRDTPKAQRYIPSLDAWVHAAPAPVKLALDKLSGTGVYEVGATLQMPDGRAIAIGGTGNTSIFTPGPGTLDVGSWVQGPTFPADTSAGALWPTLTALDSPACVLPSGRVVFMGGTTAPEGGGYFSQNPVLLEYDPASGAGTVPQLDLQPALPAGNYTWQSAFLLLPTGQLLCSAQGNTLFLYTPDPAAGLPKDSWRPGHIHIPDTMEPGHSYKLRGTQLNGLTQAVSYGDDAGMATNYPIVRLHRHYTGEVVYLRSHKFSTMGIHPGHDPHHDAHTCTIDIPAGLAHGPWELRVIANGIPSEPVPIEIGAHVEHAVIGKIDRLNYDRFGDFTGLTITTSHGSSKHFEHPDPGLEHLARRAFEDRSLVEVRSNGHPHEVEEIVLLAY